MLSFFLAHRRINPPLGYNACALRFPESPTHHVPSEKFKVQSSRSNELNVELGTLNLERLTSSLPRSVPRIGWTGGRGCFVSCRAMRVSLPSPPLPNPPPPRLQGREAGAGWYRRVRCGCSPASCGAHHRG